MQFKDMESQATQEGTTHRWEPKVGLGAILWLPHPHTPQPYPSTTSLPIVPPPQKKSQIFQKAFAIVKLLHGSKVLGN